MIDWFSVFANSLWIVALAVALACLSYASWQASIQRVRLRVLFSAPAYQIVLNGAGALFCTGLALTSLKSWQWALWVVFAVVFTFQTILAVRLRWREI